MADTSLTENLRSLSRSFDEEDLDLWIDLIAPLLPRIALSPEALDEILAPLDTFLKTNVLGFLARIGRREVANTAAALVEGASGFERLQLAEALIERGDPRGFEVMDALHLHSLLHSEDDKDGTVPLSWITYDTLLEQIGTPEAEHFRRTLLVREHEHRESRNPPPSYGQPASPKFLLEPLDAVPADTPLLADDDPRHFWLLSNGGSWKLALGQNIGSAAPEIRAVYPGTIFVGLYHGTVAAIRPDDGGIISTVKLIPGNLIFWGDYSEFVTAEGELEVGVFNSKGQFLWKASLGDVIETVELKQNGVFEMWDSSGNLGRYEALTGTSLATTSEVPFQAGNRDYTLKVKRSGESDFSIDCAGPGNVTPIACKVAANLFASNAFAILYRMDDRTGLSVDDAGFTYDDGAEGQPPGGVTLFSSGEKETVARSFSSTLSFHSVSLIWPR